MRSKVFAVLKIAVSALSLLFVLHSADLPNTSSALAKIDPCLVFMALVVFWLAQIASSLRCAYIANQLGRQLARSTAIRAHFIGLWFNQVLPTGLGGDVVKVAILKQAMGLGVAVRSVILDRVSGLLILMLAIAITLPLYSVIIPSRQSLIWGLGALSFGSLTVFVLLAWVAAKCTGRLATAPLSAKLVGLASDVWRFRRGRPLWDQFWTSAVVHLNGIATYALLGMALGLAVDLTTFALIVPLVFLVALLPISFAGWGVREAGAVWLFGLVGIPEESAFVLSVAYGLLLIIAGLPGLLVFTLTKNGVGNN